MLEGYAALVPGRTRVLRYSTTLMAFAAIYLIWGSTYFAIRTAVDTIPPLLMMSVRCAGAGALLVACARGLRGPSSRRGPREAITWRHWRAAFVAGALLFLVSHGTLAWAELRVPSGEAALLSATTPLWLTIIDWRWGSGRRPSWRGASGLALGFAGVACLVAPEWRTAHARDLIATAAVVAGALAWAAGSLYSRHASLPSDVKLAAALPLLAGGVWLALGSLAAGEWRTLAMARVTPASAAAVVYLMVFGSVVAFTAYVWLMRVVPAATVGTHAFINPIVAVTLGAALGAERIHPSTIAAALTIAGGVMLALLDRSAQSTGERHADTDSTGRPDRDGGRRIREEGVARPDVARLAPWRHRAAGSLAARSAAPQHLGAHGARGVLEVRRTTAAGADFRST